jgi:phosphonate transport system substrate-binding protein
LSSGRAIGEQVAQLAGLNLKVTVPRSYATLIEAMGQGTVQVGVLPPFAYVLAHRRGYADAALGALVLGAERRGVQFMVNAVSASGVITPSASPQDTAPLAQLAGKRPCWADPLSSSGYVIPLGILKRAGAATLPGRFMGDNTAVVRALYASPLGETCDFGPSFIDARSDLALADVNTKVIVIYRTDPIIPFDTLAFAPSLPLETRNQLTSALLTLAKTEAGQKLLKDVYQIDGLTRIDDSFYNEFRLYLDASGVDLQDLVP